MARKKAASKTAKTPAAAGAEEVKPIWITPEMAMAWLDKNQNNRPLNPHRVARYSEDMKNGNWRITGDPVRFGTTGKLLDGQHRLWACMEAEVPFQSVVFTGVSEGAQMVMDQGMGRSRGSQLHILGFKRGRDLSSACTAYWRMEGGRKRILTRAASPSNSDIYDLIEDVPEIERCLDLYFSHKSQSGVRCHVGPAVASYVYMRTHDKKKADQFFREYLTGMGLEEGSPSLALRERILQYRHKGYRVRHDEFLTWLAYAWKAHVSGRKLRRLSPKHRLPNFPGSPDWGPPEEATKAE